MNAINNGSNYRFKIELKFMANLDGVSHLKPNDIVADRPQSGTTLTCKEGRSGLGGEGTLTVNISRTNFTAFSWQLNWFITSQLRAFIFDVSTLHPGHDTSSLGYLKRN